VDADQSFGVVVGEVERDSAADIAARRRELIVAGQSSTAPTNPLRRRDGWADTVHQRDTLYFKLNYETVHHHVMKLIVEERLRREQGKHRPYEKHLTELMWLYLDASA
jgi:hypothetical protein